MTNGDALVVICDIVFAAGAASSKSPNSSSSGSFGDVCSIAFVTLVTVEDIGDVEEVLVTSEDGLVTELDSIALRYSEEKSKLKLGTIGKLKIIISIDYRATKIRLLQIAIEKFLYLPCN